MNAALALVAGGGLLFGLANAAHCAGMCGAFSLHAGTGPRPLSGWSRYAGGKLFAYVFLGTLAAALGARLSADARSWQVLLGLVAAAALLLSGLQLLAEGRTAPRAGGRLSGWVARALGDLRRHDLPGGRFGLGVLSGLLPCGVVYLAVLQSAALARPVEGLVFMAAFGLGTLPALGLAAWVGGSLLRRWGPARLRVAGGLLLCVLGVLGAARAFGAWHGADADAGCLMCVSEPDAVWTP